MSLFRLTTGLLALLLVLGGRVLAEEKPNPIVDAVKAAVKDTSKPFAMGILIKVKEGKEAAFEEEFSKAIKPSRQEKGCLRYDLNKNPQQAGHYVVYERWQDLPALQAHLKSKHFLALEKQLADVLAEAPDIHVLVPVGE